MVSAATVDSVWGLRYLLLFHSRVDVAYSVIEKLGFKSVRLQIPETGWPSKGDAEEAGATPENARKYNGYLMKLLAEKKGTPMRPNMDTNVYFFALFNKNLKPGRFPTVYFWVSMRRGCAEKHAGLRLGTSSDGYLAITADDAFEQLLEDEDIKNICHHSSSFTPKPSDHSRIEKG